MNSDAVESFRSSLQAIPIVVIRRYFVTDFLGPISTILSAVLWLKLHWFDLLHVYNKSTTYPQQVEQMEFEPT